MAKHKHPLLVHAEYIAVVAAYAIIGIMPLRLAYSIAAFLATVAYFVDLKHRRRTIQHIMHAGVASTKADASRLARKVFVNLGKVAVEIVKTEQIFTPENVKKNFVHTGPPECVEALHHDKRGTVFVSAHYGNWEFSGLYGSITFRPILSVMRPFDNPKLNDFVTAKRNRYKQRMCDKRGALKQLLGALRSCGAVAMLSDQHAGHLEGVVTTFFGHPACTHASPASLHLKTGAPLVLGVCRRIDDTPRFEIILRGPYTIEPSGDKAADIQKLTQMFTTDIEKLISECPEQWLWPHRRWLDINRGNG